MSKLERYTLPEAEKEAENALELEAVRDFFLVQIGELISPEKSRRMSPYQLFVAYQEYINMETSFDNFKKFLIKYNDKKYQNITENDLEKNREINYKYRQYLQEKISDAKDREREQYEDGLGEEIPIKKLEKLAKASRMVLGYHTSPRRLNENDKIELSTKEAVVKTEGGLEAKIPAGFAHYSINPSQLYKHNARFVYFVEGNYGHLETAQGKKYAEATNGDWAVSGQRDLHVRAGFELTDKLVKELKLGFK